MGRVALVQPDVDEEGLVAVRLDEGHGVRSGVVQAGDRPALAAVEDRGLVVAVGVGCRSALGLGVGEMPLAEVGGAVAGLLEEAGQRGRVRVEPVGHASGVVLGRRREMLVDGVPGRVTPGHQGRAAGRADGVEHVELEEVRALSGEPVDVGGLQPRMAVAREVAPAPVVGEDDDDVRLFRGSHGFHQGNRTAPARMAATESRMAGPSVEECGEIGPLEPSQHPLIPRDARPI